MPQGSILGLVLFILHTSNIPSAIKESSEDTTIAAYNYIHTTRKLYTHDTQTVDQFSKLQLQKQLAKTSGNIAHTQDSYAQIWLKMNSSKDQCMLCGPGQVFAGIRRDFEPEINAQGESAALDNVVKEICVLSAGW